MAAGGAGAGERAGDVPRGNGEGEAAVWDLVVVHPASASTRVEGEQAPSLGLADQCHHDLLGNPPPGAWPGHAQAVLGARREELLLPEASVCRTVASTHSAAIDAATVASMAVPPVTRAMTPVTRAS